MQNLAFWKGRVMEESYAERLAGRARLAKIATWAVLVTTVGLLVTDVMQAANIIHPVYMSQGEASVIVAIAIAYTICFVLSVIFVAMFLHRAQSNLHRAEMDGLEFTPGWAVGWYFIPFANLVKPFQAMRELWNKSTGRFDNEDAVTPGHMGVWWGTWLLGNFLANISFRLSSSMDLNTYLLSIQIGAISDVLIIVAAATLLRLMGEITRGQSESMGMGQVFA